MATVAIPCPACASTEYIAVVQTNGTRCVVDGRDEASGAYIFVGMSLGADGLMPAYDDELIDDTDDQGRALLRCLDCGHEWRDNDTRAARG
jgi:uncharacterized Zn finger protein